MTTQRLKLTGRLQGGAALSMSIRAYPDTSISKRPGTEIPPPAVPRLSTLFSKGGSEGAAEQGICSTRQSYGSES
jgi:hypothetical protein